MALIASSHGALAAVEPYDFKGIPLGISEQEFRLLRHPDGWPSSRVVCTGDNNRWGGIYQVTMYGKRKKADLKKCVFYGDISRIGSESVTGLSMAASGYASYKYEFLFTPDRDDVYRLYMIYVPTSIAALDDVLKALIFKLGEPTSQYSSKVQNRLGAMFPKKTYHWKNAVSSIMLSGPSGEVDDMMLQLVQDELQDIATERLESVLATTENPI